MAKSFKAGFLTGFFCALLGSLIIGGAWWFGTMLGEKNKQEKLERIEFEEWKARRSVLGGVNTPMIEEVDVEMGTLMSVEEISKRLDQINRADTKK